MRIIARLDIKGEHVVKGVCFEGIRKIGDPKKFCKKYYDDGADEILITDVVASLYGRNNLFQFIEKITEDIFIPKEVKGTGNNVTRISLDQQNIATLQMSLQTPDWSQPFIVVKPIFFSH